MEEWATRHIDFSHDSSSSEFCLILFNLQVFTVFDEDGWPSIS